MTFSFNSTPRLARTRAAVALYCCLGVFLSACDGDSTGPENDRIGPAGGNVSLANGQVTLYIPQGALSEKVKFTATPVANAPASDLFVPGSTYDIGPSGTTFSTPATLAISFDPSMLPEGVSEDELGLQKVVEGIPVLTDESQVNTTSHSVAGRVTSLSIFGAWGVAVDIIELSPTSATLSPGGSVQLAATSSTSDGRVLPLRPVTWSSSNPLVAEVDQSGLVTAQGAGVATITASSGGKSAESNITVGSLLEITTESLDVALVGHPFTESLRATGGEGNNIWKVTDGQLPEGLSLFDFQGSDSNALIEGTPTVLGRSVFTVQVSSQDGQVVQKTLSLDVVDEETFQCDEGRSGVTTEECYALFAIANATQNPQWPPVPSGSPCDWTGVLCEDGVVWGLHLMASSTSGTIPPEFGDLLNLEYVSLSGNFLTGPLPTEIGRLAKLTTLDLWANQLTGPIPAELGNLVNLEVLRLGGNQFTGPIPAEIGQLSSLVELSLPLNQLTGPIPPALGSLSRLESLDLGSNRLSGSIPAELGDLSELETLWLATNQLTGPVPPELGSLSKLGSLSLRDNQLTGSIPPELGNLSSLDLGNNLLTGPIPAELGNLSNPWILRLEGNQLDGAVPFSVAQLGALIQATRGAGNCTFYPPGNDSLYVPDTVEFRAADLDGDGKICGVGFSGGLP